MKWFFDDVHELVVGLYCRWQDEKQYEDINDYAKPIVPIAEQHGLVFGRMSKHPFGFSFTLDGRQFKYTCTSKASRILEIK